MPLDGRKVIARQAAIFLRPNSVVNLGIGIPEGIASVADEEGVLDRVTLTVEGGAIGGGPSSRLRFGGGAHPRTSIHPTSPLPSFSGCGAPPALLSPPPPNPAPPLPPIPLI